MAISLYLYIPSSTTPWMSNFEVVAWYEVERFVLSCYVDLDLGVDLLGYMKNNWLVFKIFHHRHETSCTPKSPIYIKGSRKLNDLIEEGDDANKILLWPATYQDFATNYFSFIMHDMSTFFGWVPSNVVKVYQVFRYFGFLHECTWVLGVPKNKEKGP